MTVEHGLTIAAPYVTGFIAIMVAFLAYTGVIRQIRAGQLHQERQFAEDRKKVQEDINRRNAGICRKLEALNFAAYQATRLILMNPTRPNSNFSTSIDRFLEFSLTDAVAEALSTRDLGSILDLFPAIEHGLLTIKEAWDSPANSALTGGVAYTLLELFLRNAKALGDSESVLLIQGSQKEFATFADPNA
ncbi:MAG TPA: hypothetical protein VGC72_02885, partial [Candidatus Elarobacter sp.]